MHLVNSNILNKKPSKAYYLIGFFCFLFAPYLVLGQSRFDSLKTVYTNGNLEIPAKIKVLSKLSKYSKDLELKLKFSAELIALGLKVDSVQSVSQGYIQRGNAYKLKSEYSKALESYFAGAEFKQKNGRPVGQEFTSIADVYQNSGNIPNAKTYYRKALTIYEETNNQKGLATVLTNAGDMYFDLGELDTAQLYTQKGGIIFNEIGFKLGHAYSLGNLGMIFAAQGKDWEAETNMNKAMEILESLGEYYPICVYLTYISDIYQKNKDTEKALKYASQSLKIAETNQLKQQIRDGHLKLSMLYEENGTIDKSLYHYKTHVTYRDSINNLDAIQNMADLRTDFEVNQKQVEVDLLNQEKRTQNIIRLGLTAILGLVSFLLFFVYKSSRVIRREKQKSDKLLLSILPEETANELKEKGKVAARRFEKVSVMFTDFEGFTKYSEGLSPEELVQRIDYYFSKFDEIIEEYGLEKIKTIGDAYMCTGGLPDPNEAHAVQTVAAALAMLDFLNAEKRKQNQQMPFEIRIGINSGPVVAGVVGLKKFAYDIWGDTVNTAARMETHSKPGKINISDVTYQLVRHAFDCEFRGKLKVKNKGFMDMYFVTRKVP